jgi:hypothetical protein
MGERKKRGAGRETVKNNAGGGRVGERKLRVFSREAPAF